MRLLKTIILSAGCLLCAVSAFGADTSVDIDLRQAAKLHMRGETEPAIAIWKKWAEQGDADAAYNLGLVHHHADGVPRNDQEALRWYRLAAERGDKPAQFQIGLMYQNGEGVPADEAKAHEWFTKHRRAHAHHHHNAQYRHWQQEAKALIEERDRHETLVASHRDGERILAELRRRAGMEPDAAAIGKLASARLQRPE
jgi:TPR repeat protein